MMHEMDTKMLSYQAVCQDCKTIPPRVDLYMLVPDVCNTGAQDDGKSRLYYADLQLVSMYEGQCTAGRAYCLPV